MDKTNYKNVNLKSKKKGGENMLKKLIMVIASVAMVGSFASLSVAAISGSKHDFTASGGGSDYKGTSGGTNRFCIFCHTPHNAELNVPLWNRTTQGDASYMLYTTSATLSATVADSSSINSTNISYKCLSCHDGTVVIGGASVMNQFGQTLDTGGLSGAISSSANIGNTGNDLTDDHPIGFDFSAVNAQDTYIYTITAVTTGGMKFYNSDNGVNQMECASCHDVHNNAAPGTAFLRTSNNGSALCLTCHNK
jgi:predicted CXXCH cytochrome family protein